MHEFYTFIWLNEQSVLLYYCDRSDVNHAAPFIGPELASEDANSKLVEAVTCAYLDS